jgi:rhodanese-related sulfurtransferase
MRKFSRILVMLLAVGLIGMMTACDNSTEPEESDVEALANHMDTMLQDWSPVYPATSLYSDMTGGDAPFILSVRQEAHYNDLHITGAVHVGFGDVDSKATLDAAGVPTDSRVVAYCYTGHSGQAATTIMKFMGYDIVNLKFGMMAWYSDAANGGADGGVEPYDPENGHVSGDVEQSANALPESDTYDLPDLDFEGSTPEEMAASAAANWNSSLPIVSAANLVQELNGADPPTVLSVRSADHYAIAHIPGAYNIPWKNIAKIENLTKLDPDADYVVYCYTGHTGQIATTVLNNLGYSARNLKYGMMGWNPGTDGANMGGVGLFDPSGVIMDADVVEGE